MKEYISDYAEHLSESIDTVIEICLKPGEWTMEDRQQIEDIQDLVKSDFDEAIRQLTAKQNELLIKRQLMISSLRLRES